MSEQDGSPPGGSRGFISADSLPVLLLEFIRVVLDLHESLHWLQMVLFKQQTHQFSEDLTRQKHSVRR